MLKTETHTRVMGARVLDAFVALYSDTSTFRYEADLDSFYEHGQWWVTDRRTGAIWSACDAEGGADVADGFCFEQVAEGDADDWED